MPKKTNEIIPETASNEAIVDDTPIVNPTENESIPDENVDEQESVDSIESTDATSDITEETDETEPAKPAATKAPTHTVKKLHRKVTKPAKDIAISAFEDPEDEDAQQRRNAFARLRIAKTLSWSKKGILRGTVLRLQLNEHIKDPDIDVLAVSDFMGVKVLIPAKELGLDIPATASKEIKQSKYCNYISAMLGAEINFTIKDFNKQANVAVASRRNAMAIKRQASYVDEYLTTGMSRMQGAVEAKTRVEARVIAVAGSTVRVEVFGVETAVYARDACHRFVSDLSKVFHPGQKVFVILKNIEFKDNNTIKIEASIKDATPNKMVEHLKDYSVGSLCIGKITGSTDNGYFIAIGDKNNGIDAFCNRIKSTEYPSVGDTVACSISSISLERGQATAKITRIIQRANNNYSF